MSVRVSSLVWQLDVPMADKIVLLKMADCANDKGQSIHPSCAQVAQDCGCSERHVQRVWSLYREKGLLMAEGTVGGRGRATVYSFDLASLKGAAQPPFTEDETMTASHPIDTAKGAPQAPITKAETLTVSRPSKAGKGDRQTVNASRPFVQKGDCQSEKGDTQSRAVGINLNQNSISGARQEPSGKGGVGGKPAKTEVLERLPEALDTPEFRSWWAKWQTFRRETRHALTPTTVEMQLEKLASLGPSVAAATIRQSIENGWQGLFPSKLPPRQAKTFAESAAENLALIQGGQA